MRVSGVRLHQRPTHASADWRLDLGFFADRRGLDQKTFGPHFQRDLPRVLREMRRAGGGGKHDRADLNPGPWRNPLNHGITDHAYEE